VREDKGEKKDEPKLDKDGKVIEEDDFEPYIPEDPKKEDPKPDVKKEDTKVEEPAPAKDSEVEAFAAKLKADGYEDDAIKDLVEAVELGGKLALKRLEAARAEESKTKDAETAKQQEQFADRRRAEFQVVGKLQKDGRLPKVPVEIQKKLADGVAISDEEAKHPAVVRQNEVWGFMATENKKVAESGDGYFITTFAQALDLYEAKEMRDGKSKETEREAEIRKAKAGKVAGGSSGGGAGDAKKPGYIRGQSLDQVAADIAAEYRRG